MVSIEFICQNGRTSFTGGETINGTVIVKFERQMTIKAIEADLVGKSSFEVNIHRTTFKVQSSTYYRREPYFSTELTFLGDPNGLDVIVKPEPDSYSYPLLFTLPPNIPTLFKGKKGSVEYSLKVIVKRGIFKPNIKKTFILNVNSVLDLNRIGLTRFLPNTIDSAAIYSDEESLLNNVENVNEDISSIFVNSMKFPREVTVLKSLGCLYDMQLVFMVKQTGFAPGENIKFNAHIFNNGCLSIRPTFQIFQEVQYNYAVDQSGWLDSMAKEYNVVFKFDGPTIGPGSTEEWNINDSSVEIPLLPPTNLGVRTIISVTYCAQVILKSCGGFQLTGSIPITIGTIPLTIGAQEALRVKRVKSETFEGHKKSVKAKRFFALTLFLVIFCILSIVTYTVLTREKGGSD